MSPALIAIGGSLIASFGGFYYLVRTLRGRVQPNRVSWFFWSVLPFTVFFAQLAEGVPAQIILVSFLAGIVPFSVFCASFYNPRAYWRVHWYDYFFAFFTISGLALWYIISEPAITLTVAIIVDMTMAAPLLFKIHSHPFSEHWSFYGCNALGFFIVTLSLPGWSYINSAYVFYLASVNLTVTLYIFYKQNTTPKKVASHRPA